MSDKYVAKKYVTTSSLIDKTIKCPNCHQPMVIAGRVLYCMSDPKKCKLRDIPYQEVKSLTTIQRMENLPGQMHIRSNCADFNCALCAGGESVCPSCRHDGFLRGGRCRYVIDNQGGECGCPCRVATMLTLRKELDPDAPDAVVMESCIVEKDGWQQLATAQQQASDQHHD